MANVFNESTFASKYRDDFSDSAGYHRILFNSGKMLQARELIQLQTILQRQITRLSSSLLKEGAATEASSFNIDNAYEFVKLDATSTSTVATVGDILTGATSGVKAKVLEVIAAENSDPATLYVTYVTTSAQPLGSSTVRFSPGESIGSGRVVQILNSTANPAVGRGTRAYTCRSTI